jgi:hypothetical protein
VSRKSVPFTVPGGAARPDGPAGGRRPAPGVIEAHSDEWVSDRNDGTKPWDARSASGLLLDLAAERTLTEIVVLSMLTPLTLTWFWLINAMSGRARF